VTTLCQQLSDTTGRFMAINIVVLDDKHGLFSKNLILADEDPLEYQSLLDQLY